ncbi:MAG: undecaprenyl-phosphate glucose phosphotransferase [Nitrospinaceae bacterium]|nr:undecaprenyl-phosphate glucose phosphotransferase [Nitrospinaceae bacterium]
MARRYGQLNVVLLFAGDVAALGISWTLAYFFRFRLELIPVIRGYPPISDYLILLPFVWLAWVLAARLTQLYWFRVGLKSTVEIGRLARTMGWTVLMIIALTFFYRETSYSRVMVVFFMVLGSVFLFLCRRITWSMIRRLRRRGVDMRRILVVGVSPLAQRVAAQLEAYRVLGFQVVGHLSETVVADGKAGDLPILGTLGQIREVIEREEILEVYVVLPAERQDEQSRLLDSLSDSSVDLRVVPDLVERMSLNAGIEELDGTPVILLSQTPLLGWNRIAKRLMDIVCGLAALVIFGLPMFVIALLVKITSRGPVFYMQERMGLDGIKFEMYKFRSMRMGAEDESGAVWASPGDDRRTALGSFMRRTSLDELPQLFNVLKGDMSLVGPRPERPVFVDDFRKSVPGYMLRHKMKSGMTGWAQVNGWRGDTSIDRRIECDLYYIENWSLAMDLKILWLTVWKGFVSQNAY